MLEKALEALRSSITDYLVRLPELNIGNVSPVHLSHVVRQDGTMSIPEDSLGITLVHIEEERTNKSQRTATVDNDGRVSHQNPEVRLNLYVLISANFTEYPTGLRYLSGVIRFFQAKDVFTLDNTPVMDPAIQKLIVELQTQGFEERNHLWSSLGAKYIPSVLYKVRLLTIIENIKTDEGEPVKTVDIQGKRSD